MSLARQLAQLAPVQLGLYAALRCVFAGIQAIPLDRLPAAGRRLGGWLHRLARKPVRTARKNVARCPHVVAPARAERFVRRVFENLGVTIVELLRLPRAMTRASVRRVVRLERFDIFDRLLREGRGVIVAIGHIGNYELAGLATALAGYPLHSIARPLENPWLDRYLTRLRQRTGQVIIPRDGAMARMGQVLRANGILAVQPDLDAKDQGVLVDFLGRPASVHPSQALLALRHRAPIVVVDVHREDGAVVVSLDDPIDAADFRGRPDAPRELTREITRRFERLVLRRPEEWMWFLDRWRWGEKAKRGGDGG